MNNKVNPYNDKVYQNEEPFRRKEHSYEDENEEYFPEETLKPPHY